MTEQIQSQDKPKRHPLFLSDENILNDPYKNGKKPSREPTESELQELVECTEYHFHLLDPTPGFITERVSPHIASSIENGAGVLIEYGGEKYREIGKKLLNKLAWKYETAVDPMFITVMNPQTREYFDYCEKAVPVYLEAGNVERARKLLDFIKKYTRPSRLTEDLVKSAEREKPNKAE